MSWKKVRDQYQLEIGNDTIVICSPCSTRDGDKRTN